MKMLIRWVSLNLLLIFFTSNAFAQWQNMGGPQRGLPWNIFKKDGRLFAATRNSVSFSDDDGKSWRLLKGSNQFFILDDVKVDGNDIYITGSFLKPGNYAYQVLLKTSDMGESWGQVDAPEAFSFDVFNDTLVVFDETINNRRVIVKTEGGTKTIFNQPTTATSHGPVVKHDGYYFFAYNDKLIRTRDFVNREVVFDQPLLINNPHFTYKNQLFIGKYNNDKVRFQIFRYNGTSFDLYSETLGILGPFANDLSFDDKYFSIKQSSTGDSFFSSDTLKTFAKLGTSQFKGYFVFTKLIDGFLYGSRDNGIYRLKVESPTVHEEITNNYRGAESNFFSFSNDDLFVENNPVWSFDTNDEIWTKRPELSHNTYAFSGDSLLITLKKKGGKPDSLFYDYFFRPDTTVLAPPGVFESTLFQKGNYLIYGNNDLKFISKNAGKSWFEYRSTTWDNYMEVTEDYVIRSLNLASYYSQDLINWKKIKLYFKDQDLGFITSSGDVYRFDGYELTKEDIGSGQVTKIKLEPSLGGRSMMCIKENLIFLGHPYKGVFVSINDGTSWSEINDGLNVYVISDLKIHKDDLYLGSSLHIYKRSISDLNTEVITGKVFYDVNQNGKADSTEVGVPGMRVFASKDQFIVGTDSLGTFKVYSSEGAGNELSVILPPRAKATNGPVPIVSADTTYKLGVYFDPKDRDVSIRCLSGRTFRPGFIGRISLIVKNHNFFIENSVITLRKDPRLTLDSASDVPTSVEDTLLTWENFELDQFESREIILYFRLDSTTAINELLMFTASINLLQEVDVDTTNNECKLTEIVRGSFDPNDKLVNPAGDLLLNNGRNDDVVTYTIRFQNTGNYPAEFVRIVDTLDSKIDLKSFEFLSASHAATWSISGSGVLTIRFDDINLVDSFTDNLASQGYFAYTVRLKDNLVANATLSNKANIYFDFNQAIVTNTVQNKLALPNLVNHLYRDHKIDLYPQPAGDYVTLRSRESDVIGYSIMQTNGALVQTALQLNPGRLHNIKIDHLRNGSYILKVKLEKGEVAIPFIKIE
ncbi:MAG TPA: hypothetical protein PKA12_07390 [Saprospiraceae bacterium]|nr:hypothetical protein [Saprospiraceae bacterium]